MFERFTAKARAATVGAREAAGERGDGYIGTEHLLLALVRPDTGIASAVLAASGVTPDAVAAALAAAERRPSHVTQEDLEVLQGLGIDATAILDDARQSTGSQPVAPSPEAIRAALEGALEREDRSEVRTALRQYLSRALKDGGKRLGEGHVPFTAKAKKALENSLREAIQLKDNYIGTEHLLLGLLRTDGLALEVLRDLGVDLADVRQRAIDARPSAA